MKRALWLVVLPLIAAGCLGGGSGHAASGGATSTASTLRPSIDVRVSYPVGGETVQRSKLAACPSGATCHDVRLGTDCSAGVNENCLSFYPNLWIRVAVRRLICSPSGGDYQDVGAACAAFDDLAHRLPNGDLPVPFNEAPRARAIGRYNGHPLTLELGPCSPSCGGQAVRHDLVVLMPQ